LNRRASSGLRSVFYVRIAAFRNALALLLILFLIPSLALCEKSDPTTKGFSVELPNPEADVLTAVQAVADDHVIHGTYMYEREKILNGAVTETSSKYFGPWNGEGHVVYKVRRDALAPRNFKNSSDIGVITVRYIVHATSSDTTHLEVFAVFVEDGTNRVHPSNTSVESSEFSEIQNQLLSMQKDRQMAAEARNRKNEEARKAEETAALAEQQSEEAMRSETGDTHLKTLERRAGELQRALEVRIANQNTELKAAPFHGAATLTKLPANSDVLVEILTTYWYGVETVDGHRGWIRRDQAVQLP
jgi:hypothetical protein